MSELKPLSLKTHELEQHLDQFHYMTTLERVNLFNNLPRAKAEDLFLNLSTSRQFELLCLLSEADRRSWIRLMEPDDAADLIQQFTPPDRPALIALLDHDTQSDVRALLAFEEDEAGGLMNSRFLRLRPDIEIDVAIRYLRAQTRC